MPNHLSREDKHKLWLRYLDSYLQMEPLTLKELGKEFDISYSQVKHVLDDERYRYRCNLVDNAKTKGLPNKDEIIKLAWLIIIEALYSGDVQVAKQIVNGGIKIKTLGETAPSGEIVHDDEKEPEDIYSDAAAAFVSEEDEDDDGNAAPPNLHNG